MSGTVGKSGLSLLSAYGEEEDDVIEDNFDKNLRDQDNFVNSSAKKMSDSKFTNFANSTNRLPLPSSISQLYKDNPEVHGTSHSDPALHEGRMRSFPHQRGNWSTFVYVPYRPEEEFLELQALLKVCAAMGGVEFMPVLEPHISLTRTVVLLHHWIESFVSSVKFKLSCIPCFRVELAGLAVYCNEERTRTFLGLNVLGGSSYLRGAALALDECLTEFSLPAFYEDPSFHMSILWVVGDRQETLENLLPRLQAEFHIYFSSRPHITLDITECLCKTGNKLFSFPLARWH